MQYRSQYEALKMNPHRDRKKTHNGRYTRIHIPMHGSFCEKSNNYKDYN